MNEMYRSLYWRISFAFIVFVAVLFVAQSLIFAWMFNRSLAAMPGGSPNAFATIAANDIAATIARDPNIDLQRHVEHEYGRIRSPMFVIMRDGRTAGNLSQVPSEIVRGAAEAAMSMAGARGAPATPRKGPPMISAPIEIDRELRGVVVVPPFRPGVGGTGMILLGASGVLATAVVAFVVFGPAHRRLRGLEEAAERLGTGDLTARAPESGGDEIARVARAFNRMASDLAARDEAVRTSDRQRRQLLADVSHELKTPLTTMRGYLETLHMPQIQVDASTRDRYLNTVEQETLRMERIVKDLLDLARFENGAGALAVRPFSVERLFARVVQRHEREVQTRQVVLRTAISPDADELVADPDRIEQVIDNLVANALRHSRAGGSIDLRSRAEGATSYLSVSDSGDGIPPDHLPYVFDRFYKVAASRHSAQAGSGLGLSIAKAIVERHGGSIAVDSVPGRTTFTIGLPKQ